MVELSAELFPRFKQLYGKDSRLWTRNSILHGVRKLKISSKTKNEFFMPIFEQEHEHLLKGAAALGAFEAQQSNYRSEIFDYLVNYCQFLEQEAKWNCLDSDPWGGPSICIFQLVDACLLLSSSSNIEEVRHLALVLEKPSNVFELVEKLFFKLYGPEVEGRVFSTWALEDGVRVIKYCKGTNDKPVELIKYQTTVPEKYKRVIELVLQLDKFWEVKSNLLNVFGFPHSRYELGEIV